MHILLVPHDGLIYFDGLTVPCAELSLEHLLLIPELEGVDTFILSFGLTDFQALLHADIVFEVL